MFIQQKLKLNILFILKWIFVFNELELQMMKWKRIKDDDDLQVNRCLVEMYKCMQGVSFRHCRNHHRSFFKIYERFSTD